MSGGAPDDDSSRDPDGNSIGFRWYVYSEPSAFRGDVKLSSTINGQTSFIPPSVTEPPSLHIILEVVDNGTPKLVSYRRAVVTLEP
jgi:hypothetical protein